MASNPKRNAWISIFLSVTALAIGQELWAAFDASANTTPWTDLIATYVPWPATALAILTLCVWLPLHFYAAYRAKRAARAATPRPIAPQPQLLTSPLPCVTCNPPVTDGPPVDEPRD